MAVFHANSEYFDKLIFHTTHSLILNKHFAHKALEMLKLLDDFSLLTTFHFIVKNVGHLNVLFLSLDFAQPLIKATSMSSIIYAVRDGEFFFVTCSSHKSSENFSMKLRNPPLKT